MASGVISKAQFHRTSSDKVKDPSGDPRFNRPRFGGKTIAKANPRSKTMHVASGHVPKPPDQHPHHRKAGKRTRRAR